jgi:hypothetical protein
MTFSRRLEPQPLVAAAVVHVARGLREAPSARRLLTRPVLVPGIADYTVLTDLDEAIAQYLPALASVCGQPHDRLGVEHVLVRAPLARRIPVAGLIRLASHSEDWAAVEFNRVIPHRLLARRYIEDFDFYENQIAGQLVDRLRRYLARRIRNLGELNRHLARLKDYEQALQHPQSHWKRERLATLLAEATEESLDQVAPVMEALTRIQDLYNRINLLRGSPLYRRINRQATIPPRLPRTNLLSSDRHYHDTALLWEAWALREGDESTTRRQDRRDFPTAYVTYVVTIILRACAILGLAPAERAKPPWDGTPVELTRSDDVPLRLRMKKDGTIELWSDQPVVRIVAQAENLTADESSSQVRKAIADLFQAYGSAGTPTIVVYPGLPSEREKLPKKLKRMVHWSGPRPSYDDEVPQSLSGVIPVTPLEIESTERIARALRWTWYARWLRTAYPPRIEAPAWLTVSARDWLQIQQRPWKLLRLPTQSESRELRTEIEERYAQHRRSSRTTDRATAIGETMDGIHRAEDIIRQLATCPLCHQTNRAQFEARPPDTFHCLCKACSGQWGNRTCGTCTRPFPVLWAKPLMDTNKDRDYDGDKIDARFGSEVLALPCPSFPAWTRFRCPWCNTCQGSPSCGCD